MRDTEPVPPRPMASRLPRLSASAATLGLLALLAFPGHHQSPGRALALLASLALTSIALLATARSAPERLLGATTVVAAILGGALEAARPAASAGIDAAVAEVTGRWEGVLREAERLVREPLPPGEGPRDLFAGLLHLHGGSPLRDRAGVGLVGSEGLLAWAGTVLDPPDSGPGDGVRIEIRRGLGMTAITATAPSAAGRRVADILVDPVETELAAGPRPRSLWAEGVVGDRRVTVAYLMRPETAADSELLLTATDGSYYRSVASGTAYVHLPLRAPDGTLLAVATLPEAAAPRRSTAAGIARRTALALGVLLAVWLLLPPTRGLPATLALPLLSLLPAGAGISAPLPITLGALGLAVASIFLATSAPPMLLPGLAASAAAGWLLGPAAAALLPDGLALHALACLDPIADRGIVSEALAESAGWGTAAAALIVTAATAMPGRRGVLASVVALLASIPAGPPLDDPVRLACLLPAALALGAPGFTRRPPGRRCLAAVLVIPALGAGLAQLLASGRAPEEVHAWLAGSVRQEVALLARRRADQLERIADQLATDIAPAALASARAGGDERAYTLWLAAGLGAIDVDSAIGLFSESGDLVGLFVHRLPEASVDRWDDVLGVDSRPVPFEAFERTQLRLGVAAQRRLPEAAGLPGMVRVAMGTDLRSLRVGPEHRFATLIAARLDVAGRSLWSSGGEILAVDPLEAAPWTGRARLSIPVGDDLYLGSAFLVGDERVLVAVRQPPALVVVSSILGAALLGLAAGVLLCLVAVTAYLAELPGMLRRVRRPAALPYATVLLVALLSVALVPGLLMGLFVGRLVNQRVASRIADDARHVLDTSRRTVAELLWGDRSLATANTKLDLVHQLMQLDVDLYERGVLIASSRRQLAQLGIIPRRLPAHVYVAVELEGRPLHLWTEDDRTLAATMVPLGNPMRRGVLVMPLLPQHGDADEERATVAAIVRATSLTLALAALLIATILARALSRPLVKLTQGASEIARGAPMPVVPARFTELRTLGTAMESMARALAAERQSLADRSRYIETILANAPSGVVSLDEAGVIQTCNGPAASLLGVAAGDVGTRELSEVLRRSQDLAEIGAALARHRADGRHVSVDCDLPREPPVRLRVTFLPFLSGARSGTIVMAEDVSDVARVSRMAAWADAARTVAHEIKNPLTPIALHVDHLERVLGDVGAPEPVARAAEGTFRTVREQIEALKRLASQLGQLARPPAPRTELVRVDRILRELADAYGLGTTVLRLSVPELPPVRGAPEELERLFRNLIQNAHEALAAVDAGSPREIRIRAEAEDAPPRLRIEVEDTGPGIPAELRGRVFDAHFSTKDAGSGLGLAIARKIARDHGGDLRLAAGETGACFVVELPRTG